jgi:hypothetical protein
MFYFEIYCILSLSVLLRKWLSILGSPELAPGELLGLLNVCHISSVVKHGLDACLSYCLDEFDGSGERSRAILALFLVICCRIMHGASLNA